MKYNLFPQLSALCDILGHRDVPTFGYALLVSKHYTILWDTSLFFIYTYYYTLSIKRYII